MYQVKQITKSSHIDSSRISKTFITASSICIKKNKDQITSVVLHKSFYGYTIVGLNNKNEPIQAWCDITNCILPMRHTKIKTENIRNKIYNLTPKILYLNNGEILKPLTLKFELYTSNLVTLLDTLKSKNKSNDKIQDVDIKKITNTDIPSFEIIRELDSSMTLKEYNVFYKQCKALK